MIMHVARKRPTYRKPAASGFSAYNRKKPAAGKLLYTMAFRIRKGDYNHEYEFDSRRSKIHA